MPPPRVALLSPAVGTRTPLHATGAGKALLANLPLARRDSLLERLDLRGYTARTIVDRAVLRRTLDDVREKGYALDDEEYDEGVRCVAVAGGTAHGRDGAHASPIAPPSVSPPPRRPSRQRCPRLPPLPPPARPGPPR